MELPTKVKNFINNALVGLIDAGKVGKIIKKLQIIKGIGAKKIENLVDYLIRFQDCIHYRKFKRLGLPIGSGEVESAHKYNSTEKIKKLPEQLGILTLLILC